MRETFDINAGARVRGRFRIYRCQGKQRSLLTGWVPNLVLYDWAAIAAKLLGQGDQAYRLSTMYLEYENVADPEDAVTVPTYDRTGGIAYYNALSGSADRDYLRLPLLATQLTNSDEALFAAANVATFFAQSQGVVGVHGKPFSDADNSKIFGVALVATPDQADPTADLVFSRAYFPLSEQQVKLSSSQLGVKWELELQ